MRNSYLQRIEAIKARADALAAARAARQQDETPFCEIHIDRLLGDGEALVIVHPCGRRGKTHQWSGTLKEAFEWADKEGIEAIADLLLCPTWAHRFFQRSPLYNADQKKMFLEQDVARYPELAEIYALDDPQPLLDFIDSLPQVLMFLPQK